MQRNSPSEQVAVVVVVVVSAPAVATEAAAAAASSTPASLTGDRFMVEYLYSAFESLVIIISLLSWKLSVAPRSTLENHAAVESERKRGR